MYAQPQSENLASDGDKVRPLTRVSHRFYSGLRAYIYSGWAFLIPYLATYLVYAWLEWPVNPVAAGSSPVGGGQWTVIPCLLHVYWTLHAIHVVLAVFGLRAWWRDDGEERTATSEAPEPGICSPSTGNRLPETVYRLLPWIFLALLFYVPGVYLEYPADPWTHYARTNEWSCLQIANEHTAWNKTSYFLGYSLIGHITPPLHQLQWFGFYYTGCCLLLCWQYFRLARAVGLGERTSFIFVLIQALLFGNDLFGFYRYYGMSSTLFAQLGAVALIRISLEAVKSRLETKDRKLESGPTSTVLGFPLFIFWRSLGAMLPLTALTAFNHVQGLGIAGLGIAAVFVWSLIEWRRAMIGWLALSAVIASIAAIVWLPHSPLLDHDYRSQGWLSSWYSFNLFQFSSPAFARALAILGLAGLVNISAGVFLFRHNHITAWLTLMPVIALCLPFIAIPFADSLVQSTVGEIITFNRMFLAIPTGLAVCTLAASVMSRRRSPVSMQFSLPSSLCKLALVALCLLVIAPASGPYFNHTFNTLMQPPADLSMQPVLEAAATSNLMEAGFARSAQMITTPGVGNVMASTAGIRNLVNRTRLASTPMSEKARSMQGQINYMVRVGNSSVLALHAANELYTPYSQTGYLSRHWSPNEVPLQFMGGPELERTAEDLAYRNIENGRFTYYLNAPH